MTKLKIAIISTPFFGTPPPFYGGTELVTWNLCCGLTNLGHRVVLYAPDESKVPPNGFLFSTGSALNSVAVDWCKAERDMWKKYDKTLDDYDIIIGSNWFGFEYASKARNNNLKVCHVHHGGLTMSWWGKRKPNFRLNLIGISDWMVKVYASQGFTAKRVYNGIDLKKYKLQKKKGDRLLFLGRISKIKAPHLAIEVAKKANMSLDVVGATSFVDDPSYVEHVKSLCDGKQIRFIGEVDFETKLKYLQNAKALVVPSSWGEPFGLHIVEALATGTPVLALPDGGIVETVKQGGILCSDIESMVKAIPELSRITSVMCRRNAEKFSKERMAKVYLKVFNNILSGGCW